MQILNSRIHGMLDYAAALALIALPFLIGLANLALWFSVAAGVGLIVYSLITDYSVSAANLIPYRAHLALDAIAAVAFVVAPFAFGWQGITMIYYLAMGLGVLLVVALSQTKPVPAASIASS